MGFERVADSMALRVTRDEADEDEEKATLGAIERRSGPDAVVSHDLCSLI